MPTPAPRLLAITPVDLEMDALAGWLPALAEAVDAVQLRWPGLSARICHERAQHLAMVHPRPLLLMNGRLDIALAAGLEGVHLHDGGIPPAEVPSHLRPHLLGVSRHDVQGLARSRGADYCTFSPVRPTASKPGSKVLGERGLAEGCAVAPVPVLALGGIEPDDVAWVVRAGAHGVAVLSGILGADDPLRRAWEYRLALEEALPRLE